MRQSSRWYFLQKNHQRQFWGTWPNFYYHQKKEQIEWTVSSTVSSYPHACSQMWNCEHFYSRFSEAKRVIWQQFCSHKHISIYVVIPPSTILKTAPQTISEVSTYSCIYSIVYPVVIVENFEINFCLKFHHNSKT